MPHNTISLRPRYRACLAFSLLLAGGCHYCGGGGDHCADIPRGAVPSPVGTYNGQWQEQQALRADEDFLVFYHYEWQGNSAELGPFGQRHAERLLARLPHATAPIVVETSGNKELDQARVKSIQTLLAQCDTAAAEYPVVVGHSEAIPLYGFEAARVTNGFTGQGVGAGQNIGGGGGFGIGIGASGGGNSGGGF